jgi:hypothetical protein
MGRDRERLLGIRQQLSWGSHLVSGILVFVTVVLLRGGFTSWGRPVAGHIFEGVTCGCIQLEPSEEGQGVVHWARIDLTAPGIEVYVTHKDPTAIRQGWQYRLRRIGDVVAREHLAVAINGTLFRSKSNRWPRMSGDLANG